MVYTIVVHLYAKPDAESISKLKAKLVEASKIYSKDKETLSWFVMQDVSDERKFTIVERYLKESVSLDPLPKQPPIKPLIPFFEIRIGGANDVDVDAKANATLTSLTLGSPKHTTSKTRTGRRSIRT
jgi:hypothetical protein